MPTQISLQSLCNSLPIDLHEHKMICGYKCLHPHYDLNLNWNIDCTKPKPIWRELYFIMKHGNSIWPNHQLLLIEADIQYIPRNMHTVFAWLCFVVVIHWLIFPYPSGLLHWHCGHLTIAPVPAKQPWWIWINSSCEFIMKDCVTTTKQSTTKPFAYFLGYTVPLTYTASPL